MSKHTSTVTMPPEYFRRALKDYSEWHFALIREFVQNSADAGATTINLTFDRGSDGNVVMAQDNGRGCSAATIQNKLLVLGGSEKPDGAVGGFGLAKELLYFAHPKWAIRTRDVLVEGAFGSYTLTTGHEYVNGFIATVAMADSADVLYAKLAAQRFSAAFDRPECALSINGAVTAPGAEYQRAGRRAIKTFSWGKVYRAKDVPSKSDSVWIRTSGIPSAQEYTGSLDEGIGTIVVELTGASSDILTVSRERLRNYDNRVELSAFLRSLVTDGRKALDNRVDDDKPITVFFDAEDVEALLAEGAANEATEATETEMPAPETLGRSQRGGGVGDGTAFVAVNGANMAALARGGEAPTKGALARRPPSVSRADLPDVGARKVGVNVAPNGVKAALAYLRKSDAKRDLAVWATACEWVSKAAGLKLDTVGFTFDASTEAEAVTAGNRWALFVNPTTAATAMATNTLVDDLLDVAIHEVAHITSPGGHTEAWAIEEIRIRRALRGVPVKMHMTAALRAGHITAHPM